MPTHATERLPIISGDRLLIGILLLGCLINLLPTKKVAPLCTEVCLLAGEIEETELKGIEFSFQPKFFWQVTTSYGSWHFETAIAETFFSHLGAHTVRGPPGCPVSVSVIKIVDRHLS